MDYEFNYQNFSKAVENEDSDVIIRAEEKCYATQQFIKEQIAGLQEKLREQISFGLKLRQKRYEIEEA